MRAITSDGEKMLLMCIMMYTSLDFFLSFLPHANNIHRLDLFFSLSGLHLIDSSLLIFTRMDQTMQIALTDLVTTAYPS